MFFNTIFNLAKTSFLTYSNLTYALHLMRYIYISFLHFQKKENNLDARCEMQDEINSKENGEYK